MFLNYKYILVENLNQENLNYDLFVINTAGNHEPTKRQFLYEKKILQKRYSFKTNYMQYNAANVVEKNIISKELISKWRRDIVTIDFQSEIYEMFIKYFSFENEKILFINTDTSSLDISKENDIQILEVLDLIENYYANNLSQNIQTAQNYRVTLTFLNKLETAKNQIRQHVNVDSVLENLFM